MGSTEVSPEEAKARHLRRWAWGLIALAVLLMAAGGAALNLSPDLLADALSKLFGAVVAVGVLAYVVVRGEPDLRKARASWAGAWALLLGVAPAMYLTHVMEQKREAGKVEAIIAALAAEVKKADQDTAARLTAALSGKSRGIVGSPALLEAGVRKDARAEIAAAIKAVDEGLAARARLLENAIGSVQATGAAARLKRSTVAELRAAAEKEPRAVQLLKGTRAFLVKSEELSAFVEANAAGIEARGDEIEIADPGLKERYGKLVAELEAARDSLRGLK